MKHTSKLFAVLVLVAVAGIFASCSKFLEAWDNPITHYLRIDTSVLNVKVGETVTRKPSYQSTKVTVIYASGDPSIATVDDKGAVTGVKEGTAIITVTPRGINDYYNNQIFYDEMVAYTVVVSPADPVVEPTPPPATDDEGDDDDDDDDEDDEEEEKLDVDEEDPIDQSWAQSR